MNACEISGSEFSPELLALWRNLRRSNPNLASPFFTPDFTLATAAVRDDVRIMLLRDGATVIGFLPFHRIGRVAHPIGEHLSDFQGLIAGGDAQPDMTALLREQNLSAFDFDHVPAAQTAFHPYFRAVEPSPQIDISSGYENYLATLPQNGSKHRRKMDYARRRLEREIGALSFRAHETDRKLLAKILNWRSAQHLRNGRAGLFANTWPWELMERIHAADSENFAGRLSLLYAGRELIAGHFGMRSENVWHYWFPTYNVRFAKYSPGLLLLHEILEHAAANGISIVDLGKGDEAYKQRLMNASVMVGQGWVEIPSAAAFKRKIKRNLRGAAKAVIRNGILETPVRRLAQWLRAARNEGVGGLRG